MESSIGLIFKSLEVIIPPHKNFSIKTHEIDYLSGFSLGFEKRGGGDKIFIQWLLDLLILISILILPFQTNSWFPS